MGNLSCQYCQKEKVYYRITLEKPSTPSYAEQCVAYVDPQ
jgi:hypothetical protein